MATKVGTVTVGAANTVTPYDKRPHLLGVGTLRHTEGEAEAFSDFNDQIVKAPSALDDNANSGQITVEVSGTGPVKRAKITVANLVLDWDDDGGNGGWTGQTIAEFALGYVQLLGGMIRGSASLSPIALQGNSAINAAVGTTKVDGNLSSGAMQTTDINATGNSARTAAANALGNGAWTPKGVDNSPASFLIDGSSDAAKLFLNFSANATNSVGDADGGFIFTGVIYIDFIHYPTTEIA